MRIFTLVHWTFGFLATQARTKDEIRLNSYILFDCEGYALSDTFYRIEIELLVFKLCPCLFG